MQSSLTLWSFIANASMVVKLVMLLLLIASVISWTVIVQKFQQLKQAKKSAQSFEARFWTADDAQKFAKFSSVRQNACGLIHIFQAGILEFDHLFGRTTEANTIEGVERAMQVTQSKSLQSLEQHLPFLATVGSTSPYIGLFGTVWGIMTAFSGLGNAHAATLAMVAPGISEALIATAMGLFAAIPAVIAYNRFNHEVEQLAQQYETFQQGFLNLIHRKVCTDAT